MYLFISPFFVSRFRLFLLHYCTLNYFTYYLFSCLFNQFFVVACVADETKLYRGLVSSAAQAIFDGADDRVGNERCNSVNKTRVTGRSNVLQARVNQTVFFSL